MEQFAQTVLGVADRAAIMLHGRITRTGPPDEIAKELTAAYLGCERREAPNALKNDVKETPR